MRFTKVRSSTRDTPGNAVDIDLDITGAKKLWLVVDDGGDGNGYDHADWLNPRLSGPRGETNLSQIKWRSATAGWNAVTRKSKRYRGSVECWRERLRRWDRDTRHFSHRIRLASRLYTLLNAGRTGLQRCVAVNGWRHSAFSGLHARPAGDGCPSEGQSRLATARTFWPAPCSRSLAAPGLGADEQVQRHNSAPWLSPAEGGLKPSKMRCKSPCPTTGLGMVIRLTEWARPARSSSALAKRRSNAMGRKVEEYAV